MYFCMSIQHNILHSHHTRSTESTMPEGIWISLEVPSLGLYPRERSLERSHAVFPSPFGQAKYMLKLQYAAIRTAGASSGVMFTSQLVQTPSPPPSSRIHSSTISVDEVLLPRYSSKTRRANSNVATFHTTIPT